MDKRASKISQSGAARNAKPKIPIEKLADIKDGAGVLPVKGALFENLDEWLTHDEAANYLRITPGALRNMVCNGQVSCYKLGRRSRYQRNELRSLLKRKGA